MSEGKQDDMKRSIKNPEKWIGKKVSTNKWEPPFGYNVCAKTGKFYPESQLGITFNYYAFEKSFLKANHIYIEDADWLSQEGYDEIMDVLKRTGQYDHYLASFE